MSTFNDMDSPTLHREQWEAWRRGEITYREFSILRGWLKPERWYAKLWRWFWMGVNS